MENKKQTFWTSDRGKIIGHLIHESNTGIGWIKISISLLEQLKEKNTLTDEEFKKRIELIEKGCKKISESVDYIYQKEKQNWEYEQK